MIHVSRVVLYAALVATLVILGSVSVQTQGLPQSPYSAPSAVREGLDLAPSNPLSAPVGVGVPGMSSISLTPQMFPGILPQPSNFQLGYLYSFGNTVGSGSVTLDFIQPVRFGNSAVFGEAHSALQDFWKTVTRGANNRVDVSLGGGYRTLLNEKTLIGVNGFFDSTKLGRAWYSSGSVGFEMAALIAGNDAIDLSFNWYGNLFNSNVLANAFRRGPQNYDFQVGYYHELWNGGPDFRLYATGYRFSEGDGVYGVRTAAELKTRDGMFSVKYEVANDRVNQTYHTVGGFVNVGVQFSRLLNGESPFMMPEPVFKSPRNLLRLLTRPSCSRRGAGQPTSIVLSRASTSTTTGGALGCANPTAPQGPITVTTFNDSTGIFIPFPSGQCFDRDYFIAATDVFIDLSRVKSGGAGSDQILFFWASSAADVGVIPMALTNVSGSSNDLSRPHDASVTPAGPVRGLFIQTTGATTWFATVSDIRVVP